MAEQDRREEGGERDNKKKGAREQERKSERSHSDCVISPEFDLS